MLGVAVFSALGLANVVAIWVQKEKWKKQEEERVRERVRERWRDERRETNQRDELPTVSFCILFKLPLQNVSRD
jgi:hypothetical protein